jgi:hypothetical protein
VPTVAIAIAIAIAIAVAAAAEEIMALSLPKQRTLAIFPKITGSASVICSALIAYTVIRDKNNRSKTYHRLLLGMSIADISSSFWLALSTWPIPEETGILWASGNTMTCTFQGFFTQFGISSPLYNASLSIYYLLVIRYGWTEEQMQRIEPFLHGVPLLWGLGTGVAGLFLTIFNSANLWCWVAPYEDRGANADMYRWGFFYGPLWLMVILVTVNLVLIWVYVQDITKRSESRIYGRGNRVVSANHIMDTETGMPEPNVEGSSVDEESASGSFSFVLVSRFVQRSMSGGRRRIDSTRRSQFAKTRNQVANQCFRYGAAFYFTWIPITVRRKSALKSIGAVCCPLLHHHVLTAAVTRRKATTSANPLLLPLPDFVLFSPFLPAAARSPLSSTRCRGDVWFLTSCGNQYTFPGSSKFPCLSLSKIY